MTAQKKVIAAAFWMLENNICLISLPTAFLLSSSDFLLPFSSVPLIILAEEAFEPASKAVKGTST